jgi:hypothetical protein
MSVSYRAHRARLAWVSLAVLLVAAIAGCTLKSGGYNTTSPPKVRVFNAAIDIGAVDLTLGSVLAVPLLGYEQAAPYHAASTGTQALQFTYSGSDTVISSTTQDLENGDRFSYILYGRPTAPATILVRDNIDLPGGGSYKIRFINAATETGPLDLYITAPGATLDASATPTISNVALGTASDFVEPNAGSVEVRITRAGSKVAIYDSGQVTLSERNAYELVAYSRGDPNLVNATIFTMDTLGSAQLLPSTLSELRLVNAVPGTPIINLVIDGTTALGNIAYPFASAYQPGIPGTHTVSVEPASSPGNPLVTGSQTFPPGGASTVVALGPAGSVIAVALADINFMPSVAGNARVRVVNAQSGGAGVTTFVNGGLAVGALTPGQASLYFELPAQTYTFGFVDSTSSAPLLDVPGVVLAAGHTYTLYLIGLPGQLTSLLTLDR